MGPAALHRFADAGQSLGQEGRHRGRVADVESGDGILHQALRFRKQGGDALGRRASQEPIEACDRCIDPVEEAGFAFGRRHPARDPFEELVVGSGRFAPAPAGLGTLETQAQGRKLLVARSEPGAESSDIEVDVPAMVGGRAASAGRAPGPEIAPIEFERLPRAQAFLADLLGELVGVARQLEGLHGRHARRLVVAVAVPRPSVEAGDQHQRPIEADDPHDVPQDVLPPPLPQGFVQVLGVSVVDQRAEVLVVQTVVAVGNQHFLGPDQAQFIEKFRPDGVGSALAPIERQHRCPRAEAAAEVGQGAALLVVWMGSRVEDAGGRPEPLQLLPQAGCSPVHGERVRIRPRLRQHQHSIQGGVRLCVQRWLETDCYPGAQED